ncbi:DEKNAAC100372 [Brettanomyces naardenensis]|uniref:Signal recognition particle SEC65 subunit n=1 Tax=Brettanomyces naardenensis TaxID=13370 RepID=A0A448YEV6_BRENA|nr:DEKNAAC100372 [Brettanomyces naardenensis]
MPQIEDITDADDIDDLDMDIAQFDPNLITPVAPLYEEKKEQEEEPAGPRRARPEDPALEVLRQKQADLPEHIPGEEDFKSMEAFTEEEREQLATMQVLYPCYFDSNRSVKEGRRAPLEKCVENPLAKTVLDACKILSLPSFLEFDKSHPQDFGNPGRVRVALKYEGKPTTEKIKSKRQLLDLVADYMVKHPTTLASVKQAPGPPELTRSSYKPLEVPKVEGFKMNTIVPLHSALTMKNPQTAGAYTVPNPAAAAQQQQKKQKQKIQRIRM